MKRPIKPMAIPGVVPGGAGMAKPVFEWINPRKLLVNEAYQRNLSERSVTLVRRIVANWDWARFKPPIVAMTDGGYEVIDGQHTAIAAASHPDVAEIPVMVVHAPDQAMRAGAFLGHNRDRLTVTPMQLHAAAVAAGDEDACTIDQVCKRAGVVVLKYPPGNGAFRPRETLAVSTIKALVNRRGPIKARQVLEVLANAECAPVAAGPIRAVEMLMFDTEYAPQADPAAITAAVRADGAEIEQEAKVFAAAHSVPIWRAYGVVLFKRSRRARRRAA